MAAFDSNYGKPKFGQGFDQLAACDTWKLAHQAKLWTIPEKWKPCGICGSSNLHRDLLNSDKLGWREFTGIFKAK